MKSTKSGVGLPSEVKMKDYPKCSHVNSDSDDTITGIDKVINKSVGKLKSRPSHQK